MSKVVFDKFLGIQLNHDHVNLTGDTMTGALTITPTVDALSKFQVNDQDSNVILSVDTTNNRVGIGTTEPGAKLEILGGESGASLLSLRRTTAGQANIWNTRISTLATSTIGTLFLNPSGVTADLAFAGATGDVPQMVIQGSTGNVGIGTTDPDAKLTIHNTSSGAYAAALKLGNAATANSTGTGIDFITSTSTTGVMGRIKLERLGDVADGNMSFWTQTDALSLTEKMRITSEGNVGIGTTGPGAQLQVNAGASTTIGAIIKGAASQSANLQEWQTSTGLVKAFVDPNGGISIANAVTTMLSNIKLQVIGGNMIVEDGTGDDTIKNGRIGIEHYDTDEEPFYLYLGRVESGANKVWFGGGTSLGNAATELNFNTAANSTTVTGTTRMKIDSAGNVGIGTTSPDAKIDIEGDGTTSGDNAGIRLTNTNTGGITWRIQSGLPGVSANRLAIYDVTNNKLAACFTLAGVNSPATNGGFALGGLDTALGPLQVLPTTYSPVIFGNAINSYTSTTFPTANKDYCVRSGIGTGTSAVGDYVSVWGGTGATTGLYRIIAVVDANTIQVDRNIHASGSDITGGKIAIAKDAVVFTATDGTSGQAIFSYSHQNKPLQIGGTTLLATTGLAAEDLIFGGDVQFNGTFRSTTANYRRYYHLATDSFDPGASGATWTNPSANTTGGWRLDANTEVLIFDTDVHSDWDGVSDLTVEVFFALNVAGANNDTVDLRLQCFYNTVGDTATKTQTLEVATVTDGTQYKVYKATFTINYDEVSNVVETGDKMGFILNLETDTSEIDDIIVTHAEFYYNTTHTGVESGDV